MRLTLVPLALALTACASSTGPVALGANPQVIAPALAVMAAADAAPKGVPGRFGFVVRRAEWVGPRLFLNSHPDYRDQRNLSVSIEPPALRGLRQIYGNDLPSAFRHRSIIVDGVARRVRINFTMGGRPSGKYYFQTHVPVTRAGQVHVIA